MKELVLYRGTNNKECEDFKSKHIPQLSWWSDNYETIEHYYEGCVLKIVIQIDESIKQHYVADVDDLKCDEELYTFGYSEISYPKGAIWYSFSKNYLLSHFVSIEEVDLHEVHAELTRKLHTI